MNKSQTDKITFNQTIMYITNFILGAGILTLPRTITEEIKTPDSWIVVIVSGILIIIITLLHIKLCQRYPNETFFQFNQKILGKWIGIILSFIVILYYIVLSAFEVRLMAETTRLFLLQGTPTWAIMIPFLWIGIYLVHGGIHAMARLLEIIFPLTVLCFLLVMFLGVGIFEIDNLRPVLGSGFKPVLKGIMTTSLSFAGFEVLLFLFIYMKEQNKASKAAIIGIGIPFIFYAITVVAVIGALSVDGVVLQTWPVLTYVRSYEIAGLFFERFDSILLVIWIMQIFATYIIGYFIAAQGMVQIIKKKSMHPYLYGILPIIYLISMIPKNINETFAMGGIISDACLYLFVISPIVLLFVSIVREKINAKI